MNLHHYKTWFADTLQVNRFRKINWPGTFYPSFLLISSAIESTENIIHGKKSFPD